MIFQPLLEDVQWVEPIALQKPSFSCLPDLFRKTIHPSSAFLWDYSEEAESDFKVGIIPSSCFLISRHLPSLLSAEYGGPSSEAAALCHAVCLGPLGYLTASLEWVDEAKNWCKFLSVRVSKCISARMWHQQGQQLCTPEVALVQGIFSRVPYQRV